MIRRLGKEMMCVIEKWHTPLQMKHSNYSGVTIVILIFWSQYDKTGNHSDLQSKQKETWQYKYRVQWINKKKINYCH